MTPEKGLNGYAATVGSRAYWLGRIGKVIMTSKNQNRIDSVTIKWSDCSKAYTYKGSDLSDIRIRTPEMIEADRKYTDSFLSRF